MADAGEIYAQMGRNIANSLGDVVPIIDAEHKKREQIRELQGKVDQLSQIHVKDGQIVQLDPSIKDQNAIPFVAPKARDALKKGVDQYSAYNKGRLEMAGQLGLRSLVEQISQGIQDQSLSGQRTAQIIEQSKQSFPGELAAREASTAHTKKLTEEEGKINVPGFGPMTPSQYSAHNIRMERLDILKKKSEPILNFENGLQNAYGLGIQDVVDASKPKTFMAGGKQYTGTPYYDATGNLTSAEYAKKDPEHTFIKAGPNDAMIPLTHSSGFGWQQIVPKAKSFAGKLTGLQADQTKIQQQNQQLQAQKVMDYFQQKGNPSTPEEQAAFDKAKSILGF